ncbi:hypothetical protein ACFJIV_29110 [Mucilaginibacter sp. UC70_90]
MFKSISWKEYAEVLAAAVIVWYIVIGFLYFRKDAIELLRKGRLPKQGNLPGNPAAKEEEDNEDESEEHSFQELEGIVTDIRHSILEEAGTSVSKEALLAQLQTRLAYYGGLRQPAFRTAINNFIVQQAEEINGHSFSDEELDAAWEAVIR